MDALYVFHPGLNKGLSAAYLLALLNSTLLTFLYRYFAQEEGRVLAQVKAENLYPVPIRRLSFTTRTEERTKQLAKGKQLYDRCLAKGHDDCVLDHVEHQLGQEPERADVVHDLLAFLAEQMIDLTKQKRKEVGGYLKWLERKIGAAVDDLSNKTRVRAYHEHEFTELLDVLRQNRRKLAVDPDGRAVQDSIEREFTESMAKLTPLKAEIAATDRLIDKIVYRLYGLTPEEIRIVEESGK